MDSIQDITKKLPITRLAEQVVSIGPREFIAYQHTVLCQCSMPYRDPGALKWERKQGGVSLQIEAGSALDGETGDFVQLGLPWGPKARLILAHLNAEALRTGSPVIDMQRTLTGFVRRLQGGRLPNGREIDRFKDQLSRLSVALIRMAMASPDGIYQRNNVIVGTFELLVPRGDHKRLHWPRDVHLNADYYDTLQEHAVPLDERALGALAHNAMALDIYSWLAQRLHRVPHDSPQFLTWVAIKDQFGQGYGRMTKFRQVFKGALGQVLACYPEARVGFDGRGLTLGNSPPPINRGACG